MTLRSYPGRGLHGQTVERLGMRVISGTYPPGEVIDPERLAVELDVSKTVVREALRVLGAKGLVDSRPKRGTYVRDRSAWSLLDTDVMQWQLRAGISAEFLAELSEVRAIVEPAWARLAAERRTEDDLAALREAVSAMAAAGSDSEAAIAADMAFHRALLVAAHNELLTRMDVVLTNALDARDRLVHRPGDRWTDPTPTHAAILERIAERDADGSAAAVLRLLAQADADLKKAQRRRKKS
jgi:GntR family transcriptional regulator, galactonate operon transcriptional repressor